MTLDQAASLIAGLSREVRTMTDAITVPPRVLIPVTRQVALIIADGLRRSAKNAFPNHKDLAHDLENVADEFESATL